MWADKKVGAWHTCIFCNSYLFLAFNAFGILEREARVCREIAINAAVVKDEKQTKDV